MSVPSGSFRNESGRNGIWSKASLIFSLACFLPKENGVIFFGASAADRLASTLIQELQ